MPKEFRKGDRVEWDTSQGATQGHVVRKQTSTHRAGHHADGKGVDERRRAGLVAVESGRVRITEVGEAMIKRLIEGIRTATSRDVM